MELFYNFTKIQLNLFRGVKQNRAVEITGKAYILYVEIFLRLFLYNTDFLH